MIKLDIENLNQLEKKIYDDLLKYSKSHQQITINEAAKICQCSVSKISKFVKKLGFNNFKQYSNFLNGEDISHEHSSNELERIKKYIEDFDSTIVEDLINLINQYEKIILFGYGPSLLVAQYFEYRLRTCSNKTVIAASDELSAISTIDDNTLIIILTATGTFQSFENIYKTANTKNTEVAILLEEYNAALLNQCDKIFWLSKYNQPTHLLPYEKSRTVFFIFIEEVINTIINRK